MPRIPELDALPDEPRLRNRAEGVSTVRGMFGTKLFIAGHTDQDVAAVMAWLPSQAAGIRRSYVDQSHINVAMGRRLRGSL